MMWKDRYSPGELTPTEKIARRMLAVAAVVIAIRFLVLIFVR